ncbi:MAG: hypothetical protein BZ138_02705 [Methanosphaera sp. rholeuAM270]|nr:MAG: hypothetical protein BZ138_02705 [Methanosphaera sp. rholeuAM270]
MGMVQVSSNIDLNSLKEILKREADNIYLEELHELSILFNEETRYLPENYKKNYVESVLNNIIIRFKALKNDQKRYTGKLSSKDVQNINVLLAEDEDAKRKHLNLLVVYATYFLKEPIHPLETVLPGPLKIEKKGKYYYCPIKKYHITNDNALCKYCIAKTVEE